MGGACLCIVWTVIFSVVDKEACVASINFLHPYYLFSLPMLRPTYSLPSCVFFPFLLVTNRRSVNFFLALTSSPIPLLHRSAYLAYSFRLLTASPFSTSKKLKCSLALLYLSSLETYCVVYNVYFLLTNEYE